MMVAPAVSRLAALSLAEDCQLTIIQPEQDEVIDAESVYAFLRSCSTPRAAESGRMRPLFHGKLVELKELVVPRL